MTSVLMDRSSAGSMPLPRSVCSATMLTHAPCGAMRTVLCVANLLQVPRVGRLAAVHLWKGGPLLKVLCAVHVNVRPPRLWRRLLSTASLAVRGNTACVERCCSAAFSSDDARVVVGDDAHMVTVLDAASASVRHRGEAERILQVLKGALLQVPEEES